MRRLADFEGKWRLKRVIDDALAQKSGHFDGEAVFEPAPTGLMYTERGTLAFGGTHFAATRSYLWRAAGALIEVDFEDGRFFHAFDPTQAAQTAHHDCPPDDYNVAYDFCEWPNWTSVWSVRGPRKMYVSTTRYTPATL